MTATGFAKICCVYSGLAFGLYWIPLRALEAAGFSGAWAVLAIHGLSTLIVLPVLVVRRRAFALHRLRFHLCCAAIGLAFALYAGAFLYTEVIHVIALFYLMPIWGFVMARIVIKETITPVRWLSMLLGLGGLLILYSLEGGLPIPKNAGDWMALSAGIVWAGGALMLLMGEDNAVDYTIGFLFWSSIAALTIAFVATTAGVSSAPAWGNLWSQLVWILPFVVVILIPLAYATVFGPTRLNPGIAGLLFMTEISVGTVSAALFAGEPFGLREMAGVTLITLAGIAEPIVILRRSSAAARSSMQ